MTSSDFVTHRVLGRGAFGEVLLVKKKDGNIFVFKFLKRPFKLILCNEDLKEKRYY
jgi:serine/threonine protein kinase